MTACHLTVPLNGNVRCYGKFPYFISVEHTQQKTFWFFNLCFQAFEVIVGIRFDVN